MPHQTPPRPTSYARSRSMGHSEPQYGYNPCYRQHHQHPYQEQHDRHPEPHPRLQLPGSQMHRSASNEYYFEQRLSDRRNERPLSPAATSVGGEIYSSNAYQERYFDSRPYDYESPHPQSRPSVRSTSENDAVYSSPARMNDYADDSPWHRQQRSSARYGRPYRPTSSDGVNLAFKFAAAQRKPFSYQLPVAAARPTQSPHHDEDHVQTTASQESDEEAAASALLLAAGGAPRSKVSRNQLKTFDDNDNNNQDNRNDKEDNKDDNDTAQTTPMPAPKVTPPSKLHSTDQHPQPCHVSPVSSGSVNGGDCITSHHHFHEYDDDDAQDRMDLPLDRHQHGAPSFSLVNCQGDKPQHRSFTETTAVGERVALLQSLPLQHHNHHIHNQPYPPQFAGCNTVAQCFAQPPPPTTLPPFPTLLHDILCNSEYAGSVLEWLPHGRSWRVLRWDEMSLEVLPAFFPELCGIADDDATTIESVENEVISKSDDGDRPTSANNEPSTTATSKGGNNCDKERVNLFLSHVKAWGFEVVCDVGLDMGSYRHDLFLRDAPFLCHQMVMSPSPAGSINSSNLKEDRQGHTHASPSPQQLCTNVDGTVDTTRPNASSIANERAMGDTTTATSHADDSNQSSSLQNHSDKDEDIVSPPRTEKVSTLQVPNLGNRNNFESSFSKKRKFLRSNDIDHYTSATTHGLHINTSFISNDVTNREGEENLYTSVHCSSFTGSDGTGSSHGHNWTPSASPPRIYNSYTTRASGHSPYTAQSGVIPSSPDAPSTYTRKLLPQFNTSRQPRQTPTSHAIGKTLPTPPFRVSPSRESCSGPRNNINSIVLGSNMMNSNNSRSVSNNVMAPPHLRSGRGRSRVNLIASTPPTRLNAAEQGTVDLVSSSFPVSTRGKGIRGRQLGRSVMHMPTCSDPRNSSNQTVWNNCSDLEMFRKVSDGSASSSCDNQSHIYHHKHDFIHSEPSLHLTRIQKSSSSSPGTSQHPNSWRRMSSPPEYPVAVAPVRNIKRVHLRDESY